MKRVTGILAVVCAAAGVSGLVSVSGQEARVEGKGVFDLGKETTGIVGPVREDGTVDYLAAMNEKYGKGVTKENNAFVVWLKICGAGEKMLEGTPGDLTDEQKGAEEQAQQKIVEMSGAEELGEGWVLFRNQLAAQGDAASAAAELAMLTRNGGRLWAAEDAEKVAAFLKSREKALNLMVEASQRARWWAPYASPDGRLLWSVRLPLYGFSEAGDALCARATLQMKGGDFDGFFEDVMAAKRLARLIASGGFLRERQVGVRLEAQANNAIGAAAGAGVLTVQQCDRLEHELEGMGKLPWLMDACEENERWQLLEVAETLAVGKMELLTGRYTKWPFQDAADTVARDDVDWNGALKAINGEFDSAIAVSREATWAKRNEKRAEGETHWRELQQLVDPQQSRRTNYSKREGEERAAYSERVGKGLYYSCGISIGRISGIGRLDETQREAEMRGEMARVLLAGSSYRSSNGKWPEKLEELVPGYMKEVPADMYGKEGETLKFVVRGDGGAMVYSVGINGVDDGGVNDRRNGRDDVGVGME